MQISTAMFCDFAQVREGLLFVSSGGVTRSLRDELPAPIGVFLALVIELDRFEAQQQHIIRVSIMDEDGKELAEVNGTFEFGSPELLLIDEQPSIPITLDIRNVAVERYGPVLASIYIDGVLLNGVTLHMMQSPSS
ncbi:MAG: hypothetical protein WCO36_05740 [Actinomycetes bacterium]